MKRIKIHILTCFSFALLIAVAQVSAATVDEYCRRTSPEELQRCIDDFGGDPNHDLGPDYDFSPDEEETIDIPENETVGEYCRRITPPEAEEAEVQSCIDSFGGNAKVLVDSWEEQDQVRQPLNQVDSGDGDNGNGGDGDSGNGGDSSGGSSEPPANVPPPTAVDHSVTVAGGANFQPVTGAGIGAPAVITQGVISATDVWGNVPAGTRVCFIGRRGSGVMFLDAPTAPRALSRLDHYLIGGDTCVDLPGAGTVVLVGQGGPPPLEAAPPAVPVSPQPICQIKLTETLFLRAAPAGQIVGLVWLNSEAPVYAIEGHWYQVEFEGQNGYISRYHRQVLRGAC